MILESVKNGPIIWPTVEENGVTRTKKYVELSAAEKIQADYDLKATDIILQGLPDDIYSFVNHHKVAKDLWERECLSAPTARPIGGFRADYGFVGTMDTEIRHREIVYGNIDVWEDPDEIAEEILVTDVAELEALTLLVALQSQQIPAKDLTHPDVSKEAVLYFFYDLNKMAPTKRTARASPATTTTTTPVTNAQLKALIDQGVADALAARDADRSRNGDYNHNSGTSSRSAKRTARECNYTDFLKCQPMNYKGTKGVIGLTQWFERMETVFNISNCVVENQELALMCGRMFPKEYDKIKKYFGGLPDMIHESVMASKLKRMQDAVKFATELSDKKIHTFTERQTENKRKSKDTSRNNQNQQQ
uniref:Reverse transcriptase domain-containing protein n=1 Tax=Tanacetum cinerariifolium TaxID=118510 RepID=A0A6L2MG62_TANCI|nr:reverse transcriptase domain-containing protein [Tanacetum cinerariifolium]